ncbi:uncharacterized protein LOC121054146 [Oryza brachyantha]|uniref:uncharacterized protein LOC121054146 n=1 Tax=Oryza brachyantha TaxID=4533 RepID=UPI001ADC6422|nr:uncharacterized protein LOC121054146 [Oryza brachyantha]
MTDPQAGDEELNFDMNEAENFIIEDMSHERMDEDVCTDNEDFDCGFDLEDILRHVEPKVLTDRSQGLENWQALKKAAKDLLYEETKGCDKDFTVLRSVLELLRLKAKHGWSDTSFNDLMNSCLQESLHSISQRICILGKLPNVWHKSDRMKRLYSNPTCVELMRWHQESRKTDGIDIDVFLEPLMEDMEELWKYGLRLWDEFKQEHFTLRAIIFVTINDLPGKFSLSRQIKGKTGCLICLDKTSYKYLTSSMKTVYMRHRRFLPQKHKYRKMERLFDNIVENDTALETRSGTYVYEITKKIKVVYGKGKKKTVKRKRDDGDKDTTLPFKKHSIFFRYLDYWKDLEIRHAIDVMNLEKNVFDSTIGTLLDIRSKTNDGLKSCNDLADLDIRHDLHPLMLPNGKINIPPACYSLTLEEKKAFFETVCQVEMYFPPSYLDIMEHLIVHIVPQIIELGPLYIHQMWAYEHYMSILKGYVRNRAHPEGSMIEGYTTEEAVECCMDYVKDANAIGIPTNRHEGRLSGRGTVDRKQFFDNDYQKRLVCGPSSIVNSWKGYDINGFTLYTSTKDMKSTTQNIGVRVEAIDTNGEKKSYYGTIQEIWELDYGLNIQIPVLCCQWFKDTTGVSVDDYGLTIVDDSKTGHKDDPWVLAEHVAQVFYVKDPSNERKTIVVSGKQQIVGIDNIEDPNDYNQFDDVPLFTAIPMRIKKVEKTIYEANMSHVRSDGAAKIIKS